jgi:hypothetical protein
MCWIVHDGHSLCHPMPPNCLTYLLEMTHTKHAHVKVRDQRSLPIEGVEDLRAKGEWVGVEYDNEPLNNKQTIV